MSGSFCEVFGFVYVQFQTQESMASVVSTMKNCTTFIRYFIVCSFLKNIETMASVSAGLIFIKEALYTNLLDFGVKYRPSLIFVL